MARIRTNVADHQEKEKNEKTDKRENSRPTSERLRAALLRLFRLQPSENMVCVKGVPGATGTIRKANSHLTQPKRGRVPPHHVEAAVDWCSTRLIANQAELLTP